MSLDCKSVGTTFTFVLTDVFSALSSSACGGGNLRAEIATNRQTTTRFAVFVGLR